MASGLKLPPKAIVGMVHVHALPGTPFGTCSVKEIVAKAVEEAQLLEKLGCDALIIENMHDRPHLQGRVGPEVVAVMTAVGCAVRQAISVPLGVQILCAANEEALAVAQASQAQFIRADAFVFGHLSNTGMTARADAGPLLRYRKQIGAEAIAIVADIKKKHSSHSITADLTIADFAREAEYFGADGLVVTGLATGLPTSADDVCDVKRHVSCPVWVGSGTSPENIEVLWPYTDAFIVGSYFKRDGLWSQPIDPDRVESFFETVGALNSR